MPILEETEYWNLKNKRIVIDQYPKLAKLLNNKCAGHGFTIHRDFPTRKLRCYEDRVNYTVNVGGILYLAKVGLYADEALFFPLEAILDNTISFTAVKRWSKLKALVNHCPYIPLSTDYIELL